MNETAFEVATIAVKGVRRTFILTLDRDRRHPTLESGTKQNRFLFSFVPYQEEHRIFLSSGTARMESIDPRRPASIRTLIEPLWARCMLGSDFTSQVRHRWRTWVVRMLPSTRRSLKDQPVTRSHPNKAVDLAFN